MRTSSGRPSAATNSYPIVGKCPECGGNILSGPKGFFCSGFRQGCGVGCYKEVRPDNGDLSYMVSDAEFAKLLKGEELTIEIGGTNYKLRYELRERKIKADII